MKYMNVVKFKVKPDCVENYMKALNNQVGGNHYKLPIQPVEFIYKNQLDYLRGNVIKYVTRKKNGAEDIRKAIHYCELLLELEYADKD